MMFAEDSSGAILKWSKSIESFDHAILTNIMNNLLLFKLSIHAQKTMRLCVVPLFSHFLRVLQIEYPPPPAPTPPPHRCSSSGKLAADWLVVTLRFFFN